MNISSGEKKVFGGTAPRYKRLEDYRRCRGMTQVVLPGKACVSNALERRILVGREWTDG